MPLITNTEIYQNELLDEIKLFYPDFAVRDDISITHKFDGGGENGNGFDYSFLCKIAINDKHYEYVLSEKSDKRKQKIFNKLCMYKALSAFTGLEMPWGSLTGIRPTKLAYDMLKSGASFDDVPSLLKSEYLVSPEKAVLTKEIIKNQAGYFPNPKQNLLLYVHIPFCKSICSYCAFTAEPVSRSKNLVTEYTKKLVDEIHHAKKLVASVGQNISSVYIGGGTPTSIDDESFEAVLSALDFRDIEFTCEAGRPDTITKQKISIMQKYGVNRLCVNPQTLNDATLKTIGRSHTAKDFFECYDLAKNSGMDINVDLIAGLPGESFEDFRYSLDGILELSPQNITVHTLSIKNGAELKNANYEQNQSNAHTSISNMTDYAYSKLKEYGYSPYYLYRQKHMAENLENIGYSLAGKQCAYNIASMEEALSVLACGAGGISKTLHPKGRIERLANLRDVKLYIEQSDQRLVKKQAFFLM